MCRTTMSMNDGKPVHGSGECGVSKKDGETNLMTSPESPMRIHELYRMNELWVCWNHWQGQKKSTQNIVTPEIWIVIMKDFHVDSHGLDQAFANGLYTYTLSYTPT